MTRTSARHPAQELFEATGEKVQIYARDTRLPSDAPLARLERGMAPIWRPDARAGNLSCPVPGCADPRLTTKAGSKRDHFAHLNLVGAPHGPETWFHYVGKHLVGSWARERYPEARVVVDAEAIANRQIPDVLVEFPDGRRFAFEVQYAALGLDAWAARHEGYVQQRIVDVWLFGHLPRYLRHPRSADTDRYIRTALADEIAAVAGPVRWISPDERMIATELAYTDPEARLVADAAGCRRPVPPYYSAAGFDALAECRIEGDRFVTPTDDLELEAASRLAAEDEARLAADAERLRREAETRAAAEAAKARRDEWVMRRKQERAYDYQHRVRPRVLAELGGALDVIEVEARSDDGIWLHPPAWHATLFRTCIEGRVDQTFTVAQACAPFMDNGRRQSVFVAVRAYLFFLARRGYIDFWSQGHWIESDVTVLADSAHPPPGREDETWRIEL